MINKFGLYISLAFDVSMSQQLSMMEYELPLLSKLLIASTIVGQVGDTASLHFTRAVGMLIRYTLNKAIHTMNQIRLSAEFRTLNGFYNSNIKCLFPA